MKQIVINGVPYTFNTEKSLYDWLVLHKDISRNRLQEIYDAMPGAPPMKRLRNRPTAIGAIWKALPDAPLDKPVMERKQRVGSMKEKLIDLLKVGTTIQELIALTAWQAHTIRGYISTLKSKGLPVTTTKKDGVTVYGVASGPAMGSIG